MVRYAKVAVILLSGGGIVSVQVCGCPSCRTVEHMLGQGVVYVMGSSRA